MKKIVLAIALAFLSSVTFAKKSTGTPPPAQNHSCILKDAVVQKTKKECLKAGGKWEKNTTAKPAEEAKPADVKVESKPSETPPAK